MLRPIAVVLSSLVVSMSFAQTDTVREIRKDAAAEAKAARDTAREAAREAVRETREAVRETAQQVVPALQARREAHFDSHVANCLILGNRQEIALLKYGRDKTQNSELQAQIDQMLKDHEQAITDLQPHASITRDQLNSLTVRIRPVRSPEGGVVQIQRESRKFPAEELSTETPHDRMHRLALRTSQEAIALTEAELNKFSGREFDQAFIGSQIGCHLQMLAHLKAAGSEASEPLAKLLNQQEQATSHHKSELEALMKTAGTNGRTNSDRSNDDPGENRNDD